MKDRLNLVHLLGEARSEQLFTPIIYYEGESDSCYGPYNVRGLFLVRKSEGVTKRKLKKYSSSSSLPPPDRFRGPFPGEVWHLPELFFGYKVQVKKVVSWFRFLRSSIETSTPLEWLVWQKKHGKGHSLCRMSFYGCLFYGGRNKYVDENPPWFLFLCHLWDRRCGQGLDKTRVGRTLRFNIWEWGLFTCNVQRSRDHLRDQITSVPSQGNIRNSLLRW